MKSRILLVVLPLISMTLLAACGPSATGQIPGVTTPDAHKNSGGVDVGNLKSALVPQTHALMNYPGSWTSASDATSLSLTNASGSKIEASRSDISDLSAPSAVSLQQYLQAKYPGRVYKTIQMNGLEGVRADIVATKTAESSDIYLVSELKDFIHISSQLKTNGNGIAEGNGIIQTVRVKYQGVAYPNSAVKTVWMKAGQVAGNRDPLAYSFLGDCFSYADDGACAGGRPGVALLFDHEFRIGAAGAQHGRVIDLGAIPIDAINVDGDSLVGPQTNVSLADIYTVFSPDNQKPEQDSLTLIEGHTYLVRTIDWPEEDIVTKMHIDSVAGNRVASFTYQKLAMVPPAELEKQVAIANRFTIEHEKPLSEGEVTLFNRNIWGNYFYSSFNFEFSNSGNVNITYNNWDLMLEANNSGPGLKMSVPGSGGEIGDIIDIGRFELAKVTEGQFPDPNTARRGMAETPLVLNHTYLVYHYKWETTNNRVLGAFTVLGIEKDNKWARLKFRRLSIGTFGHFQKWQDVPTSLHTFQIKLEPNHFPLGAYYPYGLLQGDLAARGSNDILETRAGPNGLTLSCDARPFGADRGFYKLTASDAFDTATFAQINSLKGHLTSSLSLAKGDVIAVDLENLETRSVLVLRVDDVPADGSLKLSVRFIKRAKTPFSR